MTRRPPCRIYNDSTAVYLSHLDTKSFRRSALGLLILLFCLLQLEFLLLDRCVEASSHHKADKIEEDNPSLEEDALKLDVLRTYDSNLPVGEGIFGP